jgi:hypothetical protein
VMAGSGDYTVICADGFEITPPSRGDQRRGVMRRFRGFPESG